MMASTNQTGNTVTGGDIVAGDKTVHHHQRESKLSNLFRRLKDEYSVGGSPIPYVECLKDFTDARDTIGLKVKLETSGRQHIIEDAFWYKDKYAKKITKFQFSEPAQEIHAFLLGEILTKFHALIYPMLRDGASEKLISSEINTNIVAPVMKIIQDEGCDDVMGLSATDIYGMIYFLTGLCHIKWTP